MFTSLTTSLLLLVLSALQHQAACSSSSEGREAIVNYLLSRGPFHERPDGAEGAGSPVLVNINLSILRILEVGDSYIKTTGYMTQSWVDPRLSYSRVSNNVSSVRLTPSQIWTPDTELYNTDSALEIVTSKALALVSRDGSVHWIPHVTMKSFCDTTAGATTLTCIIRLGSWTYSGSDIDVAVQSSVDLSDYTPNSEWTITSVTAQRVSKYYSCCPEPYLTADFTLSLERTSDD